MTSVKSERLVELAEIADVLPEPYRVVAFRELLRHELVSEQAAPKAAPVEEATRGGATPAWFDPVLASAPAAHEVPALGRNAQVAWAAIQLFARGEPIHTASVRKIVKDELGVTPESEGNVSTRLGDLHPKYLRREKDGRRYVYFPNVTTSELFDKK